MIYRSLTVLAAVWFDDGAAKAITALLKGGIIDLLVGNSDDASVDTAKTRPTTPPPSTDSFPVHLLQGLFFSHLTLLAWTVQLAKPKALAFFTRRGYKVTAVVDRLGNPALHYVAMHGTVEMAEIVLTDKSLRLEQTNSAGFTAGMLATRYGNFHVAKKLFEA